MTVYQHYTAFSGDFCNEVFTPPNSHLQGQLENYLLSQISGSEGITLIYSDLRSGSPKTDSQKKDGTIPSLPTDCGLEFVIKADFKKTLQQFEAVDPFGCNEKDKGLTGRQVDQADFYFSIKDIAEFYAAFDPNDDYIAECGIYLDMDLPDEDKEEDKNEGSVSGSIEKVVSFREYLLNNFHPDTHSITFK
jgi:hypothetical protein